MKKIILLIVTISMLLSGCQFYNKKIIDISYRFDYAMIKLPNGDIINTKITKWSDGDEGDLGWIQIWTEDNYYYTSIENVILTQKKINGINYEK